ncbi:hypothetical protein [Nannocystis bainbridge]|uniref:Uncharacterized protein n=1 Tax=Nannocystis bainbridge TaxID=2995303 RepID=A0ABT5EAW1_9BACT|nr:hypothetical protein [Nannocystis bainbridge]MDC0722058.1 hypothetical protein [Nannocystis bainbridge]
MSDLAPTSAAPPEPARAPLPATSWLRSKRPLASAAARIYVPMAIIAGGLIFAPRGPVFWGLLAGAALWFALFPVFVQGLLGPLERAVMAATPSTAPGLLGALRERRRVRWFAPFAWTAMQEGRLHLVRGEGRASAKALTEAARLAGTMADPPAGIVSAQAHALLIADVPEQARDLLQAQAKRQALGPWDQLHLAAAQLLAGKPRADEVRALLDTAQAALGATPRVLATRALLEQRAGASEPALSALRGAEAGLEAGPDRLAEALVERARRMLRPAVKASEKRARKLEARAGERKDVVKDMSSGAGLKGQAARRSDGAKDMSSGAGPNGQAAAKVASAPRPIEPGEAAVAAPSRGEPAVAGGVMLALPVGAAEDEAERPDGREAEQPRGKRNVRREERRAARRAAKAERRGTARVTSTPPRSATRQAGKPELGSVSSDRSGKTSVTARVEAPAASLGGPVARAGGVGEALREPQGGAETVVGRAAAPAGSSVAVLGDRVEGAGSRVGEARPDASVAGADVLGDRGGSAAGVAGADVLGDRGGSAAGVAGPDVLGDRAGLTAGVAGADVLGDRAGLTGSLSGADVPRDRAGLTAGVAGADVPRDRGAASDSKAGAPSAGALFGHLGAPAQSGPIAGRPETSGPVAAAGVKPPAFSVPLAKPPAVAGLPVGGSPAGRPPLGLPPVPVKSPPAASGPTLPASRPAAPPLAGASMAPPVPVVPGAPLLPPRPAAGAPLPGSRPSAASAPLAASGGSLVPPAFPAAPLVAPPLMPPGGKLSPPVAQAPSVAPPVVSAAAPAAPGPGVEPPAAAGAEDAEWDSLLDALDGAPGPKPL